MVGGVSGEQENGEAAGGLVVGERLAAVFGGLLQEVGAKEVRLVAVVGDTGTYRTGDSGKSPKGFGFK